MLVSPNFIWRVIMAIIALFKSTIPSIRYVFKDGFVGHFLNGRLAVEQENYAKELAEEVGKPGRNASKHPYIFVDEDEPEIDTEALSPVEQAKKDAYEQGKADALAALNLPDSTSKSDGFAASMASSANIAQASPSDSGAPQNLTAAQMIAASKATPASATLVPAKK